MKNVTVMALRSYMALLKDSNDNYLILFFLDFSRFSGGRGIEVAKYLNARNVTTPAKSKGTKSTTTGKWNAGHISIILRNEIYSGTYHYLKRSKLKKETIEIKVPAIIDQNSFESAQRKLIENADAARGRRGRNYLLRGLIFCGNCGRAMVGSSGHSKKGRVYYRCTSSLDSGTGKVCNAKMVKAIDIENAAWQDIQEVFKKPEKYIRIVEKNLKKNQEELSPVKKEISQVDELILEKQTARGKVLSLCARGIVTDLEAESELENLAREIKSLTARKEVLFSKLESAHNIENEIITVRGAFKELQKIVDKDNLSEEDKALLVRSAVKRVDVFTSESNGKKEVEARILYRFNSSMDLSITGDAYNSTTPIYFEASWMIYSRAAAERLAIQ